MDEEQINTLRAALHNWIDHATVEQLERMNQVVATDARRFVPVVTLPQEEKAEPKSYRIVYTSEERREETDRLANEGRRKMFEKHDNERKEQLKRLLNSDP